MAFKGKIQIRSGKWGETTTTESNLTENQLMKPIIRDFLEHADKRMISTLLTSGAVGPYGVGYVSTKVGKVDESRSIGSSAYRFDIMGRIQIPSVILEQVGSSGSDGSFQLMMKDNYLYPGMNVLFNGGGFQARVMSAPTGTDGAYIYSFKSPDGTVFSWSTHVAGQTGTKTVMGGYSSYGEKSLRGYGRNHTPDSFIQHMTTQRKAVGITGDALSDVVWYDYTGEGANVSGWRFEAERQNKAAFCMENEFGKWEGKSTMKNDDGTLRVKSRLQDEETGMDIIQGDGVLEQLYGGNETYGSGTNGMWTTDDISDMLKNIRKQSNMLEGNMMVGLTGEDGFLHAQNIFPAIGDSQNTRYVHIVNQTSAAGGAKVDVGFKFGTYNVGGDQIVLIKHPMFDDNQRFTAKGSDNKSLKSSQIIMLTTEIEGKKNVEILSKGAHGASRSMVEKYLDGLTGLNLGATVSGEDALRYEMLKQDMIIVYNTKCCGIIHKNS